MAQQLGGLEERLDECLEVAPESGLRLPGDPVSGERGRGGVESHQGRRRESGLQSLRTEDAGLVWAPPPVPGEQAAGDDQESEEE